MTNFQAKQSRTAWLTPERAVVVVPILAGLALAATLASALITLSLCSCANVDQWLMCRSKNNALPVLVEPWLSVVLSKRR